MWGQIKIAMQTMGWRNVLWRAYAAGTVVGIGALSMYSVWRGAPAIPHVGRK
jgi:hypothetical protein